MFNSRYLAYQGEKIYDFCCVCKEKPEENDDKVSTECRDSATHNHSSNFECLRVSYVISAERNLVITPNIYSGAHKLSNKVHFITQILFKREL